MWLVGQALYVIFDGLLTAITAIFTAIDLSSFIATYSLSWAGVPTQMIWFVNAVSIPTGITMICAAIGIRMLINLIPAAFTRI
jgi:F0F1-type ATP synthase membrane subunit c/vacuolar-type H+-ATPase subunit K